MSTPDDIESKLARLGARVAAASDQTRAELAAIGFLEAATAIRETFGARLTHLRTPRLTLGREPSDGQPFNAHLRPQHVDTDAPTAPAKATRPQTRRRRRAPRPATAPPRKTWHDYQAER